MSKQKVAIVHDWLYGGGAELVVQELHNLFPDAPIYTSYCSEVWRNKLDGKVVTGYLQAWPFAKLRKFLPLLRQWWFKSLDLSEFDLVISSSGNGEAKFVNVLKTAAHVCYCHSPTHFYWRKYDEYLKNPGFRPQWLVRLGLKLLVGPLKRRDYAAAQNVDYFIANSNHIKKDIKNFYGRQSVVIHPPVNVAEFSRPQTNSGVRHGYIIWGRHVPYKRFDLAIRACNKLQLPLTVVGSGPETAGLKKIAGPTVTFTGFASHDELTKLAQSAKAFLFPGEEDFGISPVEAMSLGLPVVAYKSGGALDYVIEGKTGSFFTEQTVDSLVEALSKFDDALFNTTYISRQAEQFSSQAFQRAITQFLKEKL